MNRKINVTIYNEFFHEVEHAEVRAVYPQGIHAALAGMLRTEEEIGEIRVATLADHEQTLSQEVLDSTDVMIWWGHVKHHLVNDEAVERVVTRVRRGMGFIALHSAHACKPLQLLLGTESGRLRWRESEDRARLWTIATAHPIAQGLPQTFVVPVDETYGEPFGIPTPDELVFITWFEGGEVFRSGCTWTRGEGKIFYLQNGHETFPVYYQSEIQTIIKNAVKWACPIQRAYSPDTGPDNAPALEGPKAGL